MKQSWTLCLMLAALPLLARGEVKRDPWQTSGEPCSKCAQIWPTRGPDWIITPNGGPCVYQGANVHIVLDFIYWTARQDQLTFAVHEPIDGAGSVTDQGTAFDPDWCFSPGFKAGVGLLYDHDGWDLFAQYTWLHNNTKRKKVEGGADERLTLKPGYSIDPPGEIRADWQLRFNRMDASLGRNFFISRYLKLRPHFGLTGTWQSQDFPIDTFGLTDSDRDFSIRNDMSYWGIGIRAGIDSAWHFSRCSSIYANASAAALWERFVTKTKVFSSPDGFVYNDFSSGFHTVEPFVDFSIGVRWETWFCCDRYHVWLQGGWEMQWWHGQNHFNSPNGVQLGGDLIFQGGTAQIRLDF